jgi:hypothetical protein
MFLTKPTIKQFRRFHQCDGNDQDECSLALALSAQHFSSAFQTPRDPVVLWDEPGDTNAQREEALHEGADKQIQDVKLREQPLHVDFHDVEVKKNKLKEEDKDEFQDLSPKTLKLLWHYCLGHLPFSTIN